MIKGKFEDIVTKDDGFLRGPFGSALKKSLFVPKSEDTYKVYEQGVVLERNSNVGRYYISKDYYENNMSRFSVKPGDFLVSCSGVNYGAIYQLPEKIEPGIINQALLRIRLNNDIVDENYFIYYFRAYIVNVITGGTGDSTIPNFPPMSVVKAVKIQLPSIEIQRKVGTFLRNIENKINNNNKIIEELEQMAKTIYDYWFLQYEFPNENGKTYKSSGGKIIWNEELKKDIPEGWNVRKIGDILSKIPNTYKYISSEYKKDGKFPIIDQSSNYICGYTDREEDLLKLDDCVVFGDHTKFVKYVNFNFARGADGTQILDSSDDRLPNYLLYMQIFNMQLVSQGYSRYFKFLKDKYVIIPKKEISDMYISKVKKILEKIRKCREENKELSNLRDFLLPLLMNGQVGFKN